MTLKLQEGVHNLSLNYREDVHNLSLRSQECPQLVTELIGGCPTLGTETPGVSFSRNCNDETLFTFRYWELLYFSRIFVFFLANGVLFWLEVYRKSLGFITNHSHISKKYQQALHVVTPLIEFYSSAPMGGVSTPGHCWSGSPPLSPWNPGTSPPPRRTTDLGLEISLHGLLSSKIITFIHPATHPLQESLFLEASSKLVVS